ncbi:MAG TPA: gluconate 2-dehydrogenase subunit 3 family protein [Pseudonocardia sp.]|jgi:hypothetical protein|nr:gluconate 2-dehydrogenase subunit 3 family protein [Pseudonocardia sp.]
MAITDPFHLPNRRDGGKAADPSWLPQQQRGTTPQMIGRYPDYDVLDAVDSWDEATRNVVLARLTPTGPMRFFSSEEQPTLRAFCDTVLAQDREPRVPVAEAVDAKLSAGHLDGYQYADMPDDRETWLRVLAGLDHTAQSGHRCRFSAATQPQRDHIIEGFSKGRLVGGPWDSMNVTRAWSVVMRAVLAGFYAHPWAWNEIGFGGPAYPRGFMRLGGAGTEGSEVREPFEKPGATDVDPARDTATGGVENGGFTGGRADG